MKHIGTVVRGIKTPIITKNMNLKEVVVNSLLDASTEGNFSFNDKDVVAITESVVARCENNYVNMDDICYDIKRKFHTNHIGLVFPTPVSRNRFSLILKGIARAMDKITMLLSYPDDEVGNCLFDPNLVYENNLNPFTDVLNEKEYRNYIKEATTDKDGKAIFNNLKKGKYFIKEVCNDKKFVLDDNYYEANLKVNENNRIIDIFLELENKLKKGDLKIKKIDFDTNIPIKDTEFIIMKDEKIIYQGKTNVDGIIELNDLVYGIYKIKEVIASNGYLLNEMIYIVR